MPARQQGLPGVGPQSIQEIEDKATELREAQSQRIEATEREGKLRTELRDLLKKHGFRKNKPYQFEPEEGLKLDVVLEQPEVKAYVRKHKDPKDKESEEEASEQEAGD